MKLARLSTLIFVPLALCAAVPQGELEFEANASIAQVELETDANTAEALALMQEQQEIANMIIVKQGLALFFEEAHILANKAIQEQTELLQMEDGPTNLSELLDMMFSTQAINRAQATNASSNSPLQNLINGIGGAINGISSEVGNVLNGVTGGKAKNTTVVVGGNISTVPTDPLSTVLNDVGSTLNGVVGTVGNVVGSIAGTKGNNTGLAGILGGITNTTGNILGGITNTTGSILDATGSLLNNLTDGIITPDILNGAASVIGNTLNGLLTGTVNVPNAINDIVGFISKSTGADNPLGKFLQDIATYLSNNQDGIIANAIKFSTFVNAVVRTITAIVTNAAGNIANDTTKSISDVVVGVLGKILGGGLFHRMQDISADDFLVYQNVFLDSMRAQGPNAASYAQQIIDILNMVAQKVLATDPFFLTVLSHPTEENIRRAVSTIAKVLNDHN